MHVLRYGAESRKPTQGVKIGNACIKIWSRKPSQCIKIGNACTKIWNRVFSAQFSVLRGIFEKKFGPPAPARIIITRADSVLT